MTGRGFHITAAGIEERVDWTRGALAAIRAIHAQGGAAIANHPSRDYWSGWTDEAVSMLDGYERAHPSMRRPANAADFAAFSARALRLKPGIAAIGSSDFHSGGHPGWCRTWVLARERSAAGVIAAVRDGRTVAVDMNGKVYGSPEAVRIVTASGVVGARTAAAGRVAAPVGCGGVARAARARAALEHELADWTARSKRGTCDAALVITLQRPPRRERS